MTGSIEFKHHRRPWTDHEREVLKTLYPYMGTAKVANVMLRSLQAIASEAFRLELKKDPSFYNRKSGHESKRSSKGAQTVG